MRTINASILAELISSELRVFALLYLGLDSDYYFTTCDVPIVVGGNRYEPRGMDVGNITYSETKIIDSASISIDDVAETLQSEFVGGTPQGSDVTVSLVALDSDYAVVVSAVTCFQGYLDEWSWDETKITFTATHKISRWAANTLSRHSSSCRWKFKGTQCGYSGGAAWCDRSYARCGELSNTSNFGGFRWLPSLEQKTVWWGRNKGG